MTLSEQLHTSATHKPGRDENCPICSPELIPRADNTHRYLAMRVIAFCAAAVDAQLVHGGTIDTDRLISDACKHFGVTGDEYQQAFAIRDEYAQVI